MPTVTIDGEEIEVPAGVTVLQACELAGREIPRFCYHERLSIAGNCRMCLVEIERAPKPVASCAMPAANGMVITTGGPKVQAMRKGVMEFLLLNHPLDCPICDQGGECDLQDQAMGYGFDRSRFAENKRAVDDKHMGPLIKTIMTRCIHCTRCVRFATEVAGVPDLGLLNRGENVEITTYLEKALASELSGNIIDLCPVGALTSKPYAYKARPWELHKTESIDVMDALGAAIRIDTRGDEVLRVLPRLNEDINEEWISDKTRFACDGLRRQRLDRPYVRQNGTLVATSWDEAFAAIGRGLAGLDGAQIAAITGDQADCEAMIMLKDLMQGLGSTNLDCRQDGARLPVAARAGYLFNSGLAGVEQAGALLLIGTNPRTEAPVLNARIRKHWLATGIPIGMVGEAADLGYDVTLFGDTPDVLASIEKGEHAFSETLKNANRPMLIVGQGALARPDGAAVLGAARRIADTVAMIDKAQAWNGFNVLHTAAARVGGLDLGFVPGDKGLDAPTLIKAAGRGDVKAVFLLAADEIDTSQLGDAFVVYQGHHGDAGAHRADVILPGAAYSEKSATYVNTEGRVQRTSQAAFPPGEAREDWKILRALTGFLGLETTADDLGGVRARLIAVNPVFMTTGRIIPAPWQKFGSRGPLSKVPFRSAIANFYMTDPISRASETMAHCTQAFVTDGHKKIRAGG